MEEQEAAEASGGVAQLGEHLPCKQGVMSSNLTISMKIMRRISGVCTDTKTRGACTPQSKWTDIQMDIQRISMTKQALPASPRNE